jgi:hypothetical protein
MRRALSFVLPALLSYPLIAPIIIAKSDSNLPACCRRTGQHHCSMPASVSLETMGADVTMADAGAPAIRPDLARCPNYPVATSFSGESRVASAANAQGIYASLVSHPAIQTQTEARYRVSFSRSRQKRGPPALLS